jgi:hypothetical protein
MDFETENRLGLPRVICWDSQTEIRSGCSKVICWGLMMPMAIEKDSTKDLMMPMARDWDYKKDFPMEILRDSLKMTERAKDSVMD